MYLIDIHLHAFGFLDFKIHFIDDSLQEWNPTQLLFTKGKWAYTLHVGPSRWSVVNMVFVNKRPSTMQEQFVLESGGAGNNCQSGSTF